jgi:hypothetical protein
MLAFVDLEERVPATHPLRVVKQFADRALAELSPVFDRMYVGTVLGPANSGVSESGAYNYLAAATRTVPSTTAPSEMISSRNLALDRVSAADMGHPVRRDCGNGDTLAPLLQP